jgi:hypothetical protein
LEAGQTEQAMTYLGRASKISVRLTGDAQQVEAE